ncbi:MAG: CCA tRNA nucleotidyltransferase [Coleofasciculaceae cyanobacterium SM2_1_6]|nr:CCA tRNA nucleotidyltransferase [Coleofasciculaceae cyanobacterium SM2_1_6]
MPLNALLDPTQCFFDVNLLPKPAYLVGGAVRDALLGRKRDYLDLDFVLPDRAIETAKAIANHYQAGFVILDQKRAIARVVFPQGTLDFAQMEGATIEQDLQRRDFRINAIAYNPHTKEIIDPLHGCQDLGQQLLRMVSAPNLQADPLRLLRAYRQSAQLGFRIDPATQAAIVSLAPQLALVAAERVQMELGYLLLHPQGTEQLQQVINQGLVATWLPETMMNRGKFLPEITKSLHLLQEKWLELEEVYARPMDQSSGYTWLSLAKLATLVSPQAETAQHQLTKLKYSREVLRGITTILRAADQWRVQALRQNQLSVRSQYFLFQLLGKYFPAWLLFILSQGVELSALVTLITAYLNPHSSIAHPRPLIDGKALMANLGIPPGKLVGHLLQEITIAQAEGGVSTPREAVELAKEIILSDNSKK